MSREKESKVTISDYSHDDKIQNLITSDSFKTIDKEIQKQCLDITKDQVLNTGWFNRVFGSNHDSMVVYCTLVILVLLIIIMAMGYFIKSDIEFVKTIFPVITLSIGYMFGKNS